MSNTDLNSSIQFLKGVGPARAEILEKLGIRTLGDLLFHFPRSYDDLSDVRGVGDLTANILQTVRGEIVEMDGKSLADGRRVLSIVIADTAGKCVEGVWFNQVFVASQFRFGQQVAFSGKPKWFRDHWQMNHPRVQVLDGSDEEPQRRVIPVYPLTESLRPEQLAKHILQAMEQHLHLVPDILPEALRKQRNLPDVIEGLKRVHLPDTLAEALQARRRFVYEEFLVLQVALALRRRELRDRQKAPRLPVDKGIDERIRRLFPFPLTRDQNRAVYAIGKDLGSDRPMQRLVQADVGAGKTAVAVYALLVAIANQHQAVLMAPTEVLARQHWRTLNSYLAHSRVRLTLLTGGLSAKERSQTIDDIRTGFAQLIIGTQALVQEGVEFAKLGLVVIDEQHKFGVNQRARIRHQGVDPHYLVMTATPIPRTLSLTLFGDLDISIIRQLPPGRQGVRTHWEGVSQRQRILEKVALEVRTGRQAYIVCPLVEESETLDLRAAEQTYQEVKDGVFKDFRLGLLHGRLSDDAKDSVMQRFREGEIDILVSTVVIEVGVDVPRATLMVIEHADRFGLSQLHQLRGRVSRGPVAGDCYLLSGSTTEESRQRLRALVKLADGFALAEEDARQRGLGEVFGTRQHGFADLRFGDLLTDQDVLEQARADAIALVGADAGLRQPENVALRRVVLERYGRTLALAEVG